MGLTEIDMRKLIEEIIKEKEFPDINGIDDMEELWVLLRKYSVFAIYGHKIEQPIKDRMTDIMRVKLSNTHTIKELTPLIEFVLCKSEMDTLFQEALKRLLENQWSKIWDLDELMFCWKFVDDPNMHDTIQMRIYKILEKKVSTINNIDELKSFLNFLKMTTLYISGIRIENPIHERILELDGYDEFGFVL